MEIEKSKELQLAATPYSIDSLCDIRGQENLYPTVAAISHWSDFFLAPLNQTPE